MKAFNHSEQVIPKFVVAERKEVKDEKVEEELEKFFANNFTIYDDFMHGMAKRTTREEKIHYAGDKRRVNSDHDRGVGGHKRKRSSVEQTH